MEGRWRDGLQISTPRLRISACDAEAALVLAKLASDVRIREPYRLARANAVELTDWEQHENDWHGRQQLSLVARQRNSQVVMGQLRIFRDEIGYFVHPDYWNLGYGSEMVSAAIAALARPFGMSRLDALVVRENFGSRRVLEKTGFVFRGLETRSWVGGGRQAVLRYRLML